MAGLTVEFPTATRCVDLVQMKNFLRLDDISEDDILIGALIDAATLACETFTRRSFITKGYLQTLDAFPYFTDSMLSQQAYSPGYNSLPRYSTQLWNYSQMIKLFRPPLVDIQRITYMDAGLMSYVDLVPQPLPWYPQTVYKIGNQVTDSNGNVQTLNPTDPCTLDTQKSGIRPPTWSKILSAITVEASPATAFWRNDGPAPQGEFGSYIVDKVSEPCRLFPGLGQTGPAGNWPQVLHVPNSVQIHFTAGYGPNASDVPANCVAAIMMMVSDAYENRLPVKEDEEQIPKHVRNLLWSSRCLDVSPTRG
jgi:hypothetical protein